LVLYKNSLSYADSISYSYITASDAGLIGRSFLSRDHASCSYIPRYIMIMSISMSMAIKFNINKVST